jgi:hypothetical protein
MIIPTEVKFINMDSSEEFVTVVPRIPIKGDYITIDEKGIKIPYSIQLVHLAISKEKKTEVTVYIRKRTRKSKLVKES